MRHPRESEGKAAESLESETLRYLRASFLAALCLKCGVESGAQRQVTGSMRHPIYAKLMGKDLRHLFKFLPRSND